MGMVMYLHRVTAEDAARLRADPATRYDYVEADGGEDLVDFDKAWHALHFMLTGTDGTSDSPLGILLNDGEPLATPGYPDDGSALIAPEAMAAFHTAIEALEDEALAGRFDPAALVRHKVYLGETFAEEGEEAIDYIMQGVPALRLLAARCAAGGDGALRVVS